MFPLTHQKKFRMQHKDKIINNTCQKTKLILNLNTSKDERKRHNMNYEHHKSLKQALQFMQKPCK
jgi:hypothetical protein